MTAAIIDLADHRANTGIVGDYRSRMDYETFAELLADADKVVDHLESIGADRLLVSRDELTFTVKRLHALIRGAMEHAPDVVAEVP